MTLRYNTEFPRWEVYTEKPLIRGGEEQPVFVSADMLECAAYMENAKTA